jgi:hypothetical protein
MTRIRRPRAAAALVLGLALVTVGLSAPAASSAARLSVANQDGAARAAVDGETTLTVAGSGFQVLTGGFGGVYVLFGWVRDGWRPSAGGTVGVDYGYLPDVASATNAGHQRFVAFPGSETADAASAVLSADGGFSVTLAVPGAVSDMLGTGGRTERVDCRERRCGVLTIGAHGVVSPSNETFTPVAFEAGPAGGTGGTGGSVAPGAAGPVASQGAEAGSGVPAGPTSAAREVRVGVDGRTAVPGRALAFTGQGFTAGEQVVADLDEGLAAVGPLTAGVHGEVAGVLQLPTDLRTGTHVLRLLGAASGAVAEVEVAVAAGAGGGAGGGAAAAAQAASPGAGAAQVPVGVAVAIGVTGLALVASLVAGATTAWLRRRSRRRAGRTAGPVLAETAAASS